MSNFIRWIIEALGLAAIVIAVPGFVPYRLNCSASVPFGLYQFSHGAIEPGSLISFCLPIDAARYAKERGYIGFGFTCPGWTQPLLKPVVAMEGDTIDIAPDGVTVRGVPIAHTPVFAQDSQGRTHDLHMTPGAYVVPPRAVFVLSAYHERSWDSRYFGPIAQTSIHGVMRPLWTW